MSRPRRTQERLAAIAADVRHMRQKQDEQCERLEKVERELVGEPGDGQAATIRSRIQTIEQYVEQERKRRQEADDRRKARRKWIVGVATSLGLTALAGWWKSRG